MTPVIEHVKKDMTADGIAMLVVVSLLLGFPSAFFCCLRDIKDILKTVEKLIMEGDMSSLVRGLLLHCDTASEFGFKLTQVH